VEFWSLCPLDGPADCVVRSYGSGRRPPSHACDLCMSAARAWSVPLAGGCVPPLRKQISNVYTRPRSLSQGASLVARQSAPAEAAGRQEAARAAGGRRRQGEQQRHVILSIITLFTHRPSALGFFLFFPRSTSQQRMLLDVDWTADDTSWYSQAEGPYSRTGCKIRYPRPTEPNRPGSRGTPRTLQMHVRNIYTERLA
jgi:hypothetical protein